MNDALRKLAILIIAAAAYVLATSYYNDRQQEREQYERLNAFCENYGDRSEYDYRKCMLAFE